MRSPRSALAISLLACLAAAGCEQAFEPGPNRWRKDMTLSTEREVRVDVARSTQILRANADGLAPGEVERLSAFLAGRGSPWSMDVTVQPLSAEGAAALDDVDWALVHLGVRPSRIGRVPAGKAAGDGDLAINVKHVTATAVACPDWRRSNLINLSELNSSNFGCANADNLARMIADPRDLARGGALAPASGAHAAGAVARYRTDQVKPLLDRSTGGGGDGGGGE